MGLWSLIVSQTSQSPWRLLAFGGLCIGVSAGIGMAFTNVAVPTAASKTLEQKQLEHLSYDERRTAVARQQRLAFMIRDVVEGRGDDHWNAAMRGTVVAHPVAESKTHGAEKEALARAAEAARQAEEARKRKGWWGS